MSFKSSKDMTPPFALDGVLLTLTILLVGFSLVMVYSTTGVVCQEKVGNSYCYVKTQGIAAIIGLIAMLIASRIPIYLLERFSALALPIALLLLAVIWIPGASAASGGATRWISIGGFTFQPAEIVKTLYVIFLAGYLSRQEQSLQTFGGGVIKPSIFVVLTGSLLLIQPDFGTTFIIGCVTIGMSFGAGVRWKHIILTGAAAITAGAALVITSPYRVSRITSFLSPMEDASGRGYQLIQSLIAIGSGHYTGVGLGDSQQKLFFLPAAHTDFIFAVIAEELGMIGAICVLSVFFIFLWRGLKIAMSHKENTFLFSLGLGLTLIIVVPAFVNVGVVTGLLPTKGLVLPFLGYGGSSLISSLFTVGLLMGVAKLRYQRGY